jgi:hypothetical protein
MSNSDDEMEEYIEKVKTKFDKRSKNKKIKNTFNFSFDIFNPYVMYITSFIVIFLTLLIFKPRYILKDLREGKKVIFSKLFLLTILIYIPVFFFIFLFFQVNKK